MSVFEKLLPLLNSIKSGRFIWLKLENGIVNLHTMILLFFTSIENEMVDTVGIFTNSDPSNYIDYKK